MPFYSFSSMNPDFSGAYVATADNDLSTVKLFDSKSELFEWIENQLEYKGAEFVNTTVIDNSGSIDKRLISKVATYSIDENCDQPIISNNIKVVYSQL
tara:strand:+ start:58 stop:351 length:294 start_codon:yes stop_codon:yes gene_type:complete